MVSEIGQNIPTGLVIYTIVPPQAECKGTVPNHFSSPLRFHDFVRTDMIALQKILAARRAPLYDLLETIYHSLQCGVHLSSAVYNM